MTPTEQPKTKRERFVTVAGRRTRRVLRELRLLSNCGNRSAYEYDESDVAKIVSAIERELDVLRSRFRSSKDRKEVDFSLE